MYIHKIYLRFQLINRVQNEQKIRKPRQLLHPPDLGNGPNYLNLISYRWLLSRAESDKS